MEVILLLAAALFVFTVIAIFARPEVVVGAQLFGTSLFAMAFTALGVEFGVVFTIFGLSVIGFAVYFLQGNKAKWIPTSHIEIMIALLLVYMALTLTFSPSPRYGQNKITQICGIGLPAMFLCSLFTGSPEKLRRLLTWASYYAVISLAIVLVFIILGSGIKSRLRSDFYGPLSLAYSTICMMTLCTYLFIQSKSVLTRMIAGATILGGVVVVVGTGSRGAALALVVATVCTFLRGKQMVKTLVGLTAFLCLVVASVSFFASETGIDRLLGQGKDGYRSGEGRLMLYTYGVEQFLEHPLFGQGSGSYSYYVERRDKKLYPHNSVIEVAGETGLIGLSLFGGALFLCLRQVMRMRKYQSKGGRKKPEMFNEYAVLQFLFFVGFFNSCFSFDLSLQRNLFAAIGLMAGVSHWKSLETKKEKQKRQQRMIQRSAPAMYPQAAYPMPGPSPQPYPDQR